MIAPVRIDRGCCKPSGLVPRVGYSIRDPRLWQWSSALLQTLEPELTQRSFLASHRAMVVRARGREQGHVYHCPAGALIESAGAARLLIGRTTAKAIVNRRFFFFRAFWTSTLPCAGVRSRTETCTPTDCIRPSPDTPEDQITPVNSQFQYSFDECTQGAVIWLLPRTLFQCNLSFQLMLMNLFNVGQMKFKNCWSMRSAVQRS